MWSPAGFLTRAALFLVLYVIFDFAGARAYTTFLSGTVPQGALGQGVSGYLGITYLLLYLLAFVVAPILVIAAAIFWWVERRLASRARML
jgi:hypothetical protein